MEIARDFDVLYGSEPGHVRSNANLPGHFVYPITRMQTHADSMDEFRTEIEKAEPGDWQAWNVAADANPVKKFITPYSQFSRAEQMKGSEQVVRGFQSNTQPQMEGLGTPSLQPRMGPSPVVVIQNGVKEVKRGPRLGLGR